MAKKRLCPGPALHHLHCPSEWVCFPERVATTPLPRNHTTAYSHDPSRITINQYWALWSPYSSYIILYITWLIHGDGRVTAGRGLSLNCSSYLPDSKDVGISRLYHPLQCGVHVCTYTPIISVWKVKVLVGHLCLTLCSTTDYSPPASSAQGILQASILEGAAISFSRGSFPPRDQTLVSCIAGWFFTI